MDLLRAWEQMETHRLSTRWTVLRRNEDDRILAEMHCEDRRAAKDLAAYLRRTGVPAWIEATEELVRRVPPSERINQ